MSSVPSPNDIARNATWLAQALDPSAGVVRLVAMDSDAYRSASFLDDRLMQQPVKSHVVPWLDVASAMTSDIRADARWIFHIGHVGSTLISRLLGEIDGVIGIREPRLLRDLAVSTPDTRKPYLSAVPKLMSRTFDAGERACVKATSFASEILPNLVPPGERALFMYVGPRNYIASILAGENSLKELHRLHKYRSERLSGRQVALPTPRNDAELAALAWACEMTTLESAASTMTDRMIEWANFDFMLKNMPSELLRVAQFFDFKADEDAIVAIATGPQMSRYSKDPSYEYSPTLREQLIDQELDLQGSHIETALAMLRQAAEKSPLLARALTRAED